MQKGGYSNRSRGRGKCNSNNRPICQICEKLGYKAVNATSD